MVPTHDSELHLCPYCAACGRVALPGCPLDWLDDERCARHNCAKHGKAVLNGPACPVHSVERERDDVQRRPNESARGWARRVFGQGVV